MPVKTTVPSYAESLEELINQLGEMLPAQQFAVFNADAHQLANKYPSPLNVQLGDTAPDFSLPNATGLEVNLKQLLQKGPVVLTFYRGAWCPYCNLQLKQLQDILPQIHTKGAQLLAISPQTPDQSLDMKEKNKLAFEVLSDVAAVVARQYTTVFANGAEPIQAMTDLGYDFHSFYADESGELPVPATFVIDQKGIVRLASSGGGDYRERVEPQAILDVLASL